MAAQHGALRRQVSVISLIQNARELHAPGGYLTRFWRKQPAFHAEKGVGRPSAKTLLIMKRYLLTIVAAGCLCVGASAQNWFNARTVPAGNPTTHPALSYDGKFIYWPWAGGMIISSTNWGVTWQTNFISSVTNISSIVCSTNGSKVAFGTHNAIYYSSNAGADWVKTTAPAQDWYSVAMSADGSKLVAADISGVSGIYRSEDSGQTWAQVKSDGAWMNIASSADGSILVASAASFTNDAIISTNSGSNWAPLSVRLYASRLSADGSHMIAVPQSTHTYYATSTNMGATWTDYDQGPGGGYRNVQISADGRTLFKIYGSMMQRFDPVLKTWFSDSFTGLTDGEMSGDGKFMIVSYAAAIAIWSAERPIVLRNPATLTVWPRTNLNFTASVVGGQPITYHWTFNDEPVGGNSSLLQWTATNSGTIKLTAENAFGSDTVTHTVLNVLPIGARMNIVAADNWPFAAVVAPGEVNTAVWFEWGLSNSLDRVTAITNIAPGTIKLVSVPAPRMDLGVYYVRVIASNSLGVAVSPPTRFVPSPVTASMDTGARITWNALSYNWFERGYVATNRSLGLPPAGTIFRSESEDISYQMPADYSALNAVLVDSTLSGTLNLVAPAPFSKLSFLTSAGSGAVVIQYILHHADGTTQTGTFTSNDWFNGTNTAFTAHARAMTDISTPLAFPKTLWRVETEPDNPRLYGRTITVTNSTSPIQSIELSRVSGSGHAAVFAVSGSNGGAYSPIAVTGFNQDMIIEAEFSGSPTVTFSPSGASFRALPGVQYEVRATDSLTTPNWNLVSDFTATSETEIALPPKDVSQPTQFFLIRPR